MSPWRVPLSDVAFGEEEVEAVARVVRSGWLTLGPEVRAFEEAFASRLGMNGAVAVSSGTAALHLGCLALGVGPGTEVLVPSLSFVATANAVLLAGGRPVFVDVMGADDLTLDPARVEALITPSTVGIIAMHYGGFGCQMDALGQICRQHRLFLMEDAAHAPGGEWNGRPLGTLGDLGCFSFFGNKNLTTGEGGMVVASDPEVLGRVRLLRSHGMTSMSWDRHEGHAWDYEVVSAGFNYRPGELQGALGSVQLAKLDENNRRRNRLLALYRESLGGLEGVSLPFPGREGTGHLCVALAADVESRNRVRRHLAEAGIQTSLHYPPIHLFRHYRERLGTAQGDCPITEEMASRLLTLPLYPGLQDAQVEEICTLIRRFFGAS